MSTTVLTFVIVGLDDHPIFEADLAVRGERSELFCYILVQCKTCSPGTEPSCRVIQAFPMLCCQ